MEKDGVVKRVDSIPSDIGKVEEYKEGRWQGFKNSFKAADIPELDDPNLTDLEKAAIATAKSPLSRSLKNRHLQMIAIGGSIGTGLFVGSGKSLGTGGPASVLISYALIGSMMYMTVQALGELAVRFPISGSFTTYNSRFVDPAWGFSMGWNYALGWLITLPLELVAASLTISYWSTDDNPAAKVNPDAWVALFWFVIVLINLFGARGYGEAEFAFAICKVLAVCGFIILGIVLVCGGGPVGGYIGGKYWHNPGAFHNGLKGLCKVFVNAAFAFSGTELVGLAAAEAENPRKHLPKATKQVFWRITLFYIVSLLLVGLLVPYNNPHLLHKNSSVDISASPFVIAIKNAGIKGLPSVMNVVILISVLSVGNSSVYAASRTFCGLAAQNQAPKIFMYVDRKGRPIFGILLSSAVGLLCFLAGSSQRSVAFEWLLSISGISALVSWGSIMVCHIRFRQGMSSQGRSLDELPFKAALGVWGSCYGILLTLLILTAQFWAALFPNGKPSVVSFFEVWLSLPVMIVFYVGYKLYYKTKVVRNSTMDLISGVREVDLDLLQQELEEERMRIQSKGWWYRAYSFWC